MKDRCYNPANKHFLDYGGRGIAVCERWRHSYPNFLSDMGHAPLGRWLDRADNDGSYQPDNCYWATPKEQGRNKRNNRLVIYDGLAMALSEAVEAAGLNHAAVWQRLDKGWSDEEALNTPIAKRAPSRRYQLLIDGVSYSSGEAARRFGVSVATIRKRLIAGWSDEDAVLPSLGQGYNVRG